MSLDSLRRRGRLAKSPPCASSGVGVNERSFDPSAASASVTTCAGSHHVRAPDLALGRVARTASPAARRAGCGAQHVDPVAAEARPQSALGEDEVERPCRRVDRQLRRAKSPAIDDMRSTRRAPRAYHSGNQRLREQEGARQLTSSNRCTRGPSRARGRATRVRLAAVVDEEPDLDVLRRRDDRVGRRCGAPGRARGSAPPRRSAPRGWPAAVAFERTRVAIDQTSERAASRDLSGRTPAPRTHGPPGDEGHGP